jgi:hypothetical protein
MAFSTVIHLSYPSHAARISLIAKHLPRLRQRWYFVDVPPGLEVVLLQARRDSSAATHVAAWVDSCRAAGIVDAARYAAAPLALEPRLFFGRRAPAFYVTALAIGSARAAQLLDAHAGCASDEVIGTEVATLYASLFPRLSERRRALQHYATWLEQVADSPGPATDCRPIGILDSEYVHLRRSMRTQTTRLAQRVAVDLAPDFDDTRTLVVQALVARLAHTQVVRLSSPDRTGDLGWEAGLARSQLGHAPGSLLQR